MAELSIHSAVPEIDDARLRPSLRGRTRRVVPVVNVDDGRAVERISVRIEPALTPPVTLPPSAQKTGNGR